MKEGGKEMRDILPFHFNRLEGEVIYVDPKDELKRLRQAMVRNDRKNPQAIYCGDNKHLLIGHSTFGDPEPGRTGAVAIEMWRDYKAGRLIIDECYNNYNPEADRFDDKLRNRGTKRQSDRDKV